jgi:hypothetical protein
MLTGFAFYEPYWLLNMANAAVFVHILGAYQVRYTAHCELSIRTWIPASVINVDGVNQTMFTDLLLFTKHYNWAPSTAYNFRAVPW